MMVKAVQILRNEMLKRTCWYNWWSCHHSKFGDIFGQAVEAYTLLFASLSHSICFCPCMAPLFLQAPLHITSYFDNEWKPAKPDVLSDKQTERMQTYEFWHPRDVGKHLTGLISICKHGGWWKEQAGKGSGRKTPRITLKMPENSVLRREKVCWLVLEILMKDEIYAWSVIKSAYTEPDGLH